MPATAKQVGERVDTLRDLRNFAITYDTAYRRLSSTGNTHREILDLIGDKVSHLRDYTDGPTDMEFERLARVNNYDVHLLKRYWKRFGRMPWGKREERTP